MKIRASLALLTVSAAIIFSGCKKKPSAPTPVPKPIEQVNTIPVDQRPYAILVPDAKEKGRGVVLSVYELKKPAAKGEYEIDYQTGSLLQGAFGRFKLAGFPETFKIPFKSCSAGGKCTIHEDVTGGSLLLRFSEPEKYVLKNDWAFIENKDKATAIGSGDGKFSLEGSGLAKSTHLAILQTPGLPKNPDTKVLSNGYAVGSITAVSGQLRVSIRLNEEAAAATILAWDGKTWTKLPAKVADKTATATAPKWFEAYVAVE